MQAEGDLMASAGVRNTLSQALFQVGLSSKEANWAPLVKI